MSAPPSYANAQTVRDALDIPATPRGDTDIARAIDTASRNVERACGGRRFYPTAGTRTLDWADTAGVNANTRKLWLDDNEATTVTALTVNGDTIPSTRYRAGPDNAGGFRWLELLDSSPTRFGSGVNGHIDVVSITGEFGWGHTTRTAATLDGAVGSTTATSLQVDNGRLIGQGDALRVGAEWVIVTASTWVDTTDTLAAALAADTADNVIVVAGTYAAGERILIGAERMRIVEVAGINLVVERRVDRTPLAAHSIGATIYALRGASISRAELGTSAATHADGVAVERLEPPAGVVSWTLAEAIAILANERSGYARTVGAGEAEREASGRSLSQVRKDGAAQFGRTGAVYATGSPHSGRFRW